jgi:hypothetical protein
MSLGQNTEHTFQNTFNIEDLNKVELTFSYSDWRFELIETNLYVEASMSINGAPIIPIKIAKKGNTANYNTQGRDKIPFKINGPKGFNFKLNNNYRDYTMGAREFIGYTLHKKFTGIGSNVAPSEVYVNGEFYGLYLAVEDLNKLFYKNNVGEISHRVKASPPETWLYENQSFSNLFWLGKNPEYYKERYEIKKGGIQDFINLIDIINNVPDQAYKHIDIDQVCKFLAVDNYLMNTDGIIGDVYSHNYELVKRVEDNKWQLVPWDLNLCLGAWTKPSVAQEESGIDQLTQLSLTSGRTNNALIELIMDRYFFLYHYYYNQLIEEYDAELIVSWAKGFEKIIQKSTQKDTKLYESGLHKKAFTQAINTQDGKATALIPTIEKRYNYIKGLSLGKKFSNKILSTEQQIDSIFIAISPGVKNATLVVEYINANDNLKRLRALPRKGKTNSYYAILPKEAKSYYVYMNYNGIKYTFPYNGLLEPISANFSAQN